MPEPDLARDMLLTMYYYLRLTRALEERLGILYRQGKILGGVYLSKGQPSAEWVVPRLGHRRRESAAK